MSISIIATVTALPEKALALFKTATRSGYESAAYEVMQSDGEVELRRYEAATFAETPMRAVGSDDGSFRRLFRYISGDNARSEKIAMTTPVFIAEPTAGRMGSMAFVVPGKVAAAGAPAARSGEVAVRTVEAQEVAALRFRGSRKAARTLEAEMRLRAWMQARGLEAAGPARYAFYDPPWTPGPLRRNEVQIPIIR